MYEDWNKLWGVWYTARDRTISYVFGDLRINLSGWTENIACLGTSDVLPQLSPFGLAPLLTKVRKVLLRGDALKYWKWPSYSLKSQRSLLYKHLYLSYIYLIIILFPISLCQLKNAIVRSVQSLEQLLFTLDIRIDHLYASYRLASKFLWHQYQISAIMLVNRLKFMKQSLFARKTLLLSRVLKGLHCYVRSKLI